MPEYKFYKIGNDGHVRGPAIAHECSADQDAVSEAKKIINGNDIEIWQGIRMVAYLTADE